MRLIKTTVPILAICFLASASANLVTNPGFESGTVDGWTIVGENDGCNGLQAVQYSAVPSSGGDDSIPSLGGNYAAYIRPGGVEDTGMIQTVNGVPAVELSYSVDFYVREVQLPNDNRTEQTVYLYLNDTLVDQLTVGSPSDDPGTDGNFSGTFDNPSNNVDIKIISERASCGFAWGQLIVDNVFLDCTNEDECVAAPPPEVPQEPAIPVPAMDAWGSLLMVFVLGLFGFIVVRRMN